MGEVVSLNDYRDDSPGFSLTARLDGDAWIATITDFHDTEAETQDVFRAVAKALIPIAGGLIHNAEDIEPSERGCIVANMTFFSSGNIDMHTTPIDSKEKRSWFIAALNRIKRQVQRGS